MEETNQTNPCVKKAVKLALQYNFVTEYTSLVVKETDEYVKKGPIKLQKFAYYDTDSSFEYSVMSQFFGSI